MLYELTDNGKTVSKGELVNVVRFGDKIEEAKSYFNLSDEASIDNPSVTFISADRSTKTDIPLVRTSNGFKVADHIYGNQYGCNLTKIRNRAGRWGLTVWRKPLTENHGERAASF